MRKRTGVIVAGLLVTLLAGCGGGKAAPVSGNKPTVVAPAAAGGQQATAQPRPATKMAVGGIGAQIYLPALLAKELGFFEQAGLDVEVLDVKGGADSAKALATREVEFASMALDHVVKYKTQNVDLVMLALYTRGPGMALVVDNRFKGTITSVKDLQSKKVGVSSLGSGTHQALVALLQKNGLDGEAARAVPVGLDIKDVFTQEKAVAAVTTDPYVTEAISSGQASLLYDLRTAKGTLDLYGSDYPFVGLVTRLDVIQNKPELVKRMGAAMGQTMQWLTTHSAAEVAAKVPAQFRGNAEIYVQALQAAKDLFPSDGFATVDGIETVIKAMRSSGAVPRDATVEAVALFNGSFLGTRAAAAK